MLQSTGNDIFIERKPMGFSTLVLAAGAGTRMKSEKPKVAHEILGKPLLRWVIDAARQAGADEVFTVLGHGRGTTVPLAADTTIVIQDEQLGTGHALQIARSSLEAAGVETLVVLSGDTPLLRSETIRSLVDEHLRAAAAVSVLTMCLDDPTGYGRVIRNAQGAFLRIVEHKDASDEELETAEVNSGVYCFDTANLFKMLGELKNNNRQGEFYLTDVAALTLSAGNTVNAFCAEDARELAGINDRVQLAQTTAEAQRRINTRHMLNGVTITEPTSAWIGPDVVLANDVEILPLTTLTGKTSVDWGSVIGPMSRVNNSVIGKSCVVDDSVMIDAVLEDKVSIGPRAYLRPGTIMRTGSRAGTHVEIKKSDIGPNSKVPHLSYIGDTQIGENVNLGAGTITCNYDGVNKHATVIGSGCFVGSDTMLVAPVTLGDNVIIGAGSVITRDVPAGALALTRPEQVIKEDWKRKEAKSHD
ncbi:MAG: bifunctional UDP-N-acetylglucosamine diphosphorylase/glucosamine-1-phosphate N-acetyltransferase GlmU [Coriobacteriales bacterium]|nr:bifunctional UDP-N-acetylglucosamine diphosphorylase/glucosamine-1-phosphate N-acetyltransferase GlmU [Coriobacteriales bacterium]